MRAASVVVVMGLAVGLLALLPASPAGARARELLYRDGPLSVWESATPGAPSTFEAESEIQANLFDLLAVLSDTARRPEWVRDLTLSRIVEGDVHDRVVIYERFSLPWPLDDRDSLVESVIEQNLEQLEVQVRYHEVTRPGWPAPAGVTRMPLVRGSMFFRYVDRQRSFARITMTLDVGGMLPDLAVQHFVQDAPVLALQGLVRQVRRTRGQYAAFIDPLVELARQRSKIPFEVEGRSPAPPTSTPAVPASAEHPPAPPEPPAPAPTEPPLPAPAEPAAPASAGTESP